jgi:ribose transport system permease protein
VDGDPAPSNEPTTSVVTDQGPVEEPGSGFDSYRVRGLAGSIASRGGVVIAFGLMILGFSLARPNTFPTWLDAKAIITAAAPEMIVALGLTVVLVMRDFDLSVGSMVGLADGAAVAVMTQHHVAWPLAVVVGLGLGVAAGLFTGFLVAVLGGNSFIMTLGMATILTGIEYAFTGQVTVFQGFARGYVKIGANSWLGLSNQIWIGLVVALILWVLLDATEVGRFMYAIGGNEEAARLSGIRTRTLRITGFVIVAFTAAIVGILISSAGAGYTPNPGQYLLLPAYAGAFLGAACFRPGEFNIPGTIVGVLFLGTIETGLTLLNLQTYLINLVQGAILIVAVLISTVATRRT